MTSCIKSALTLLHSNHVLKIQKMLCGCSLRISKRLSTNSLWSSSNSLRCFSNFLRLCSCLGIAEGHLQATQEDNQSDSCEYLHFLLSLSNWSASSSTHATSFYSFNYMHEAVASFIIILFLNNNGVEVNMSFFNFGTRCNPCFKKFAKYVGGSSFIPSTAHQLCITTLYILSFPSGEPCFDH